jgi:ketosteroid isomerase-like protein
MKSCLKTPTRLITLASITALLFVASSCNKSQNENAAAFDSANAKKEIEEANQNFMMLVSKGDSTGLADCYAMGAKLMIPNSPAAEKKDLPATIGGMFKMGIGKIELKTIEVWGTSDLLTEEGEVTMFTKDGQQIDKGKYLVVWKKEDGKWKLFRDMFNSNLPPPAAK